MQRLAPEPQRTHPLTAVPSESKPTRSVAPPMLWTKGVRKFPFIPKLDPLGVKTGLELLAGGIAAMLLMRWLGM